jgi:hypothetical protein
LHDALEGMVDDLPLQAFQDDRSGDDVDAKRSFGAGIVVAIGAE